jgi:biotin carboxyl carrier protein
VLLQSVLEWLAVHWGFSILAAFLLGAILAAYFLSLRPRLIKRYIRLFENSNLEEFSSTALGVMLKCRKTEFQTLTRPIHLTQNIPPPSLISTKSLPGETLVPENAELIYYLPEPADPNMPKGLIFPNSVKIVMGNPEIPELTEILPITPVLVPCAGIWLPAKVGPHNLTVNTITKKVPRKIYASLRNLFIFDYVEKDDLLGFVQPAQKKANPVPILAPISGYILQFGALKETPVAAKAIVMLLAQVNSLFIRSEYVGTFYGSENGQPLFQLGRKISAGTVIGKLFYLKIGHEIIAPCDLLLLRCYAVSEDLESGVPVEFHQNIFSYRPLS